MLNRFAHDLHRQTIHFCKVCFHLQGTWKLRVISPIVGRITVVHGPVIGARTVIIWKLHQVPGVIIVMHVSLLVMSAMDMRTVLHAPRAITDIGASLRVRRAAKTIYVKSRTGLVLTALLLVTTEKKTIHAASAHQDALNVLVQVHVRCAKQQITGEQHVSIRVPIVQVVTKTMVVLLAMTDIIHSITQP